MAVVLDPSVSTRGAIESRARPATLVLLFLAVNLLWFLLIRNGTDYISQTDPSLIFVWCAIIALATAAFAWVRFDALPLFALRFMRASSVFLVFYFVIEPFDVPRAGLPADHPAILFHQAGRWIGLFFAIAGFWRPSAVFAAAMVLWMVRDLQTAVTGFYFSTLDIRNVAEVISFVAGGLVLLAAARTRPEAQRLLDLDDHVVERAGLILFAVGVGGHLGNYFYSAVAKLVLDGGVFSWVFGNHLYDGMVGSVERGTLPVAAWPWLTQLFYDGVKLFNYPMLWFGFLAQFAAIVAPLRRRWVILITVVYDVFHVIVYVAFGLLFWKWIALNAIILSTLMVVRDDQWTRSARYACLAFVLAGAPFFKTATLAWYDASNFVSVYFEAETEDGERVRIPPAYFNSASYQISQGRLYAPPDIGHFNFNIWGSVLSIEDLRAARACSPPERNEPFPERYGPLSAISRYIETHHANVLRRVGDDGTYNYYLLPHHHVPSFGIDDPFYDLDKRTISSYVYVVESVCLGLEDGRLQRDVLKRSEFPIYKVGS